MSQTPEIGRIVHYTTLDTTPEGTITGTTFPAIITGVHDSDPAGNDEHGGPFVDLTVFSTRSTYCIGAQPHWHRAKPAHWSWPFRA